MKRARAPAGGDWDRALEAWRELPGDAGAVFDREFAFDAATVEPMISYGTNPGMVTPVGGHIPERDDETFAKTLRYMGFGAGETIAAIFFSNALKNGLVPVRIDATTHAWLLANPGAVIEIDLVKSEVILPEIEVWEKARAR